MSSQSWYRVTVNSREIGEVGIDAALAGSVGVPVVLVTGDDKVCQEARELLGRSRQRSSSAGVARHRALCLSPDRSRELICEAARRALELKGKIKPLSFGPDVEVALHIQAH